MDACYSIDDTSQIISPALVVFRDLVEKNLRQMIAMAGDVSRLRPHCKTHKMKRLAELELGMGITKHKCATFAEAEMLAMAGVRDIFLAYNLVGPNIGRAIRFQETFPNAALSVTADDSGAVTTLGKTFDAAGRSIEVLLDINTGQNRTGILPGDAAAELYQQIAATAGVTPGGFHVYDGQNHQASVDERRAAVMACWESAARLRDNVVAQGLPVPRMVCGGTGSFPIFAEIDDASIELSPGTCVFHDTGYGRCFPDLDFTPASLILTRVVSRPTADRVTFDLGYKACASDPPAGKRLTFRDIPDAAEVLQNEEHLVIETSDAAKFHPGDEQLAIPTHACPTSALHREAYVVSGGSLVDRWEVTARDRWLTV